MRFFTRERYNASQDHIGIPESDDERERRVQAASEEWEAANRQYLEYLQSARIKIPPDAWDLMGACLHDAVITAVRYSEASVELTLDARRAPFKTKAVDLLKFNGVTYQMGLEGISGQWILYEELFVRENWYEYSVLTQRTEFVIWFQRVELSACSPSGS
jgi:hypothetical protein